MCIIMLSTADHSPGRWWKCSSKSLTGYGGSQLLSLDKTDRRL